MHGTDPVRATALLLMLVLTLGQGLETNTWVRADSELKTAQSPCLVSLARDVSTQLLQSATRNATVAGNTVPTVRDQMAAYKNALPGSYILSMELVFKLRNTDQFQQCIQWISDPSSPGYGNFLDQNSLQPFLPTPDQKISVVSFLRNNGFEVTDGASSLVLRFSGSVETTSRVFDVHIGVYSSYENANFYAADSDPRLPDNLAALVNGIIGLDNYTIARPSDSPVCTGPYCPQGIQIGYGLNDLYALGYDGTGVNVAVVLLPGDPSLQNSLDVYDTRFHLAPTTLHILYPDGFPTYYNRLWGLESALDVEAVHAVAPGAQIFVLYGNSPNDDPMNLVDYPAVNHIAPIVSNSWIYVCGFGPCSDTQLPPSFVASMDLRLAVDTAQGATILFASGDYGAKPDGSHFGTTFPASDPYVLAVGATNLALTGCNAATCSGYGNETGASISGGGYSGFFPEPFWQSSTIGATPGRAVPDVSMLGSDPGFWVYSATSGWFSGMGTSLSTPLWAGFLAIATQLRDGGFGNISPILYGLASSPSYPTLFNDITLGSNGYPAGPGWDPVTGWGSPTSKLAAALTSLRITLLPTSGLPGTPVGISGSGPPGAPTLDTFCQLSSSPDGLISSPTCIVTQDATGSYTVAGSFVVANLLPGPYAITVTVTANGLPYGSGLAFFFVTRLPLAVPENFTICVIRLGVEQPNATIAWLPGYAYPGTPISQCHDKTEHYTDVLGRSIVIHQFNQTRNLY